MSAGDDGVLCGPGEDQPPFGLAEAVTREIAALAEQKGWSTFELARRARLPVRSVRQKIRSHAVLDLAEVGALATALGLDPVQLITEAARRLRPPRWSSES